MEEEEKEEEEEEKEEEEEEEEKEEQAEAAARACKAARGEGEGCSQMLHHKRCPPAANSLGRCSSDTQRHAGVQPGAVWPPHLPTHAPIKSR